MFIPCQPLIASATDLLMSARTFGIALWIGLGVLTISLFILGRTRWGQAKPLSKCVVLSIFAHFLLGAYAYGTKLIFDPPMIRSDDAFQVTMLAAGEPLDHPADAERFDQPWNEFVTNAEVHPTVSGPAPRATTEMILDRAPQEELAVAVPSEIAADPSWTTPAPPRPTVQTPGLEAIQVDRPAAMPAPIETAPLQQREQIAAVGPTGQSLPRPDRRESPPAAPERKPAELFGPQPTDEARLQELSEIIAAAETAQIQSSTEDQLAESSNRNDQPNQNRDGTASSRDPQANPNRSDSAGDAAVQADAPSVSAVDDHFAGERPGVPPTGPPLRLGDGKPLPDLYHARVADQRQVAARRHGGNERTEAAVEAGLTWLASAQAEDGRWDASRFGAGHETSVLGHNREGAGARADTGITGLALLAFLGAGHSHLEGQYRVNVQHGLEFLLRSQREDGNLAGDAELFARMYCHGMASLALTEASAITGDHRLQPFVERAVAYTLKAQHRTSGGWRYQAGDQGDMSQFGWQVMALKSAELAGHEIPELNRGGMVRFLRSVASGRQQGLASYRPGEHASVTMTAEALLCRLLLRTDLEQPQVDEAVEYLMQDLPGDGKANFYYWYYGTLAMFQIQGEPWQRWNATMQEQLLRRQVASGRDAGSWAPDTLWGGYGGRVYTTALATLCLETYYRYLPLYSLGEQPNVARR